MHIKYLSIIALACIILTSCAKEKEGTCNYIVDPTERMLNFTVRDAAYTNLLATGKLNKTTLSASQDCNRQGAGVLSSNNEASSFTLKFYMFTGCSTVYLKWDNNDTDTITYTFKVANYGNCSTNFDEVYYFNGTEVKMDTIVTNAYTLIK